MKLNRSEQEVLGSAGALGRNVAAQWAPRDYRYYERQWRTQRGAWGEPEATEKRLDADVAEVTRLFRCCGTAKALAEAQRRGVLDGARLYLSARAEHEEDLAARLARIRTRLATRPQLADKIREAFVDARLDEVRDALAKSHTPPQAVRDRPEVPRRHTPRWIPYAALFLAALALARSIAQSSRSTS